MENNCCQSCGMPFDERHRNLVATEKDGEDSIYCRFCYENGEFTNPNATLEDMIATGVPHFVRRFGKEATAHEYLKSFLPTLDRWRNFS